MAAVSGFCRMSGGRAKTSSTRLFFFIAITFFFCGRRSFFPSLFAFPSRYFPLLHFFFLLPSFSWFSFFFFSFFFLPVLLLRHLRRKLWINDVGVDGESLFGECRSDSGTTSKAGRHCTEGKMPTAIESINHRASEFRRCHACESLELVCVDNGSQVGQYAESSAPADCEPLDPLSRWRC